MGREGGAGCAHGAGGGVGSVLGDGTERGKGVWVAACTGVVAGWPRCRGVRVRQRYFRRQAAQWARRPAVFNRVRSGNGVAAAPARGRGRGDAAGDRGEGGGEGGLDWDRNRGRRGGRGRGGGCVLGVASFC